MKYLVIVLAVFMTSSCAKTPLDSHRAAPDGVFIHISHGTDDPHRLLMALTMAETMAENHEVLVYCDIKAVNVVLKDSPDVSFSHFPSSKTQLHNLLEKKVIIMACPGCLKTAGKTKEDLLERVQVANKETFFSFTKGRILTLDY